MTASSPSILTTPPPLKPRAGAMFGAYADPPEYVEAQRISAVLAFESELGRRLDIVHDYHTWTDPFPSAADVYFTRRGTSVLLSWAGADTLAITSGRYDDLIRQRALDIARLGRPVFLEWRWEMNRPNLQQQLHNPADYVAAWDHIRAIFRAQGATNAAWVWCPLVDGRLDQNWAGYYPGDDEVDWLCADAYSASPGDSLGSVVSPFLAWAARHRKPILLGEFGCLRAGPGARAAWIRDAARFVESHPQIKGVVYFESARGAAGAFDLASEPSALGAFRAWGGEPYFNASP